MIFNFFWKKMNESADLIKDYSTNPVNNFDMSDADIVYEEWNIVCGDQIKIFIKLDADKIQKFSFTWNTATVSTASASIIAEQIEWKNLDEVLARNYEYMHNLWLEVSTRRKRAVVLPLVAIINWIYSYRGLEKKVDFDDLLE